MPRLAGLVNTTLRGPLFISPMGGESCGIILDRRLPFSFRNGPIFDRRLPLPPFGTPDPEDPIFGVNDRRFAGLPRTLLSRLLGTCKVLPGPDELSEVVIWFMLMSDRGWCWRIGLAPSSLSTRLPKADPLDLDLRKPGSKRLGRGRFVPWVP